VISGTPQSDRNAQKEHIDPSSGSTLKMEAPPQNSGTQTNDHMAPKIKYEQMLKVVKAHTHRHGSLFFNFT
jgi:hypothetical protein